MRLRQLQLIKYGRFDACVFDFPPGEPDLHFLMGPNEAGKSTTRAALSDLLFNFPHRTPFDFQFDRQLLRVGAVIENEGKTIEVRRRKGHADTLLGPDDTPIGDGALAPLLGGQTRASFERMFGLDQTGLRDGGAAMLKAGSDAGQAIFAAGAGLLNVARICDALEEEAKDIWTNRASGAKRYHQAAAAYQDARTALRESEVRAYKWVEARRAATNAQDALDAARMARTELAQAQSGAERKRRVLAASARRQQAIEAAVGLADAPVLSAAEEARLETAAEARAGALAEIARLERDLATLESELKDCTPDDLALALLDEVGALRASKTSIEDARGARPSVDAQLTTGRRRLAELAAEIGWDADDAAALKERLPVRAVVADLGDLTAARSGIEEQLRSAHEGLAEAKAAVARAEAQIAEQPPPIDVGALQRVTRELRSRALPETTARTTQELQQLDAVLGAKLRTLAPWSGDVAALRALVLAADEDIDGAIARIEVATEALDAESAACVRDEEETQRLALVRRQRTSGRTTPTLEALNEARRARDDAWRPLRDSLDGRGPLTDAPAAITRFETQIVSADGLADERFEGAEHAGDLAALEREIETAELRAAQARARRETAATELQAATEGFAALVTPVAPSLTHRSYPAWRDAVADALEVATGRDDAARNRAAALEAETRAISDLAALLESPRANPTLEALLASADAVVEAARSATAQMAALATVLDIAKTAETRATNAAAKAERGDKDWRDAWTPALAKAGLPAGGSVADALVRLASVDALRTEIDRVLALETQLREIEAKLSAFDARATAVGEHLGLEGEPTLVLAEAQARIEAAQRTADRAEGLGRRLAAAREAMAQAITDRDAATADLSALLSSASEADATALRLVLTRAREARRLIEARNQAEAEIVGHGDGRTLEALLDEIADADPDCLAAEVRRLADQMDDLNAQIETLSAARQAADATFRAINDGPEAAQAATDMAQARSDMGEQAEAYMRKRAEIRLLRAGIERFRKEKQAPLLARASKLFATLTLDGFAELTVEFDGGTPKLFGVRADRATVTPVEGMSEGTADQLFLALRIAAIEDAVAQGARLPFLADDLFVNFDDARAAAGFTVLGELATKTQVLFFTHHPHLAAIARDALGKIDLSICTIEGTGPATVSGADGG